MSRTTGRRLADCRLEYVEAVLEDPQSKRTFTRGWKRWLKPGAVLSSNTRHPARHPDEGLSGGVQGRLPGSPFSSTRPATCGCWTGRLGRTATLRGRCRSRTSPTGGWPRGLVDAKDTPPAFIANRIGTRGCRRRFNARVRPGTVGRGGGAVGRPAHGRLPDRPGPCSGLVDLVGIDLDCRTSPAACWPTLPEDDPYRRALPEGAAVDAG